MTARQLIVVFNGNGLVTCHKHWIVWHPTGKPQPRS